MHPDASLNSLLSRTLDDQRLVGPVGGSSRSENAPPDPEPEADAVLTREEVQWGNGPQSAVP